jgi:hypothetical protein
MAALAGDHSKVSRSGYYSPRKAYLIWCKLFNQRLETNGLPENYYLYIQKMQKSAALYAEGYNGKRWQLLKARIYEAEAKQILTQEGERIETTCARISKFMGFPVRANECSVVDFDTYVSIMAN